MVYLAIKHLLARKKQSLITLLGVFIGTLAFIVISGFFTGFQNSMTDNLVSGDAHIKIQARERIIDKVEVQENLFPEYKKFLWKRAPAGTRAAASIENTQGWYEKLKHDPNVTSYTPVYNTSGSITNNGTTYNLSITGSYPAEQIKVTNIEDKMTKGSMLDLEKAMGGIVVGEEFATELAKEVGDVITLSTTDGRKIPFKIVGVYSTGNKRSDRSSAYMNLVDAQKMGLALGKVSQISVKVVNFRDAADIATEWSATSADKVQSWDQLNSGFLSMFQTQDMMRYMVSGVIMLVAAFGIYNILNMVVNQKRKDIAILRSMGYEAYDVIRLFLLQGITLGLMGGLLGCAIGFVVCKSLGELKMGGPKAGTFTIPFDLITYMKALAISNGAALLASFLPARAASRLTPIEIIRGGTE